MWLKRGRRRREVGDSVGEVDGDRLCGVLWVMEDCLDFIVFVVGI